MSDDEETVLGIYVLPTEEGQPPRAIVADADDLQRAQEPDEPVEVSGCLAVWSRDAGCWMNEGMPLPPELGDAITAHAKDLGVEW